MLRLAQEALTFDDVLLLPAHSTVLPHTADLNTRLTRSISLNIPMVSAAMDTVTEADLAIALAQEGGIGFIHKNMSISEQAAHVRKVKKYESGIVSDPVTVSSKTTIKQVKALAAEHGFQGFPVVDNNRLVGIVTGRDTRFEEANNKTVADVMTPEDRLITVKENTKSKDILNLMHKHRIEKILVVNDAHELRGMITLKDFEKAANKPNACKMSKAACAWALL